MKTLVRYRSVRRTGAEPAVPPAENQCFLINSKCIPLVMQNLCTYEFSRHWMVIAGQKANTLLPINLIVSGSVTSRRVSQPWKAASPMLETLGGITMSSRFEQNENVSSSIAVMPQGSSILSSELHELNAPF